MTDIATVIGWKFNHQAGMSTVNGVITAFPGGIPDQATQDTWTAEYEAYLPTKEWQESMDENDNVLPRWAEDLIDQQGIVGLAQATVDKYNGKKSLRATKP